MLFSLSDRKILRSTTFRTLQDATFIFPERDSAAMPSPLFHLPRQSNDSTLLRENRLGLASSDQKCSVHNSACEVGLSALSTWAFGPPTVMKTDASRWKAGFSGATGWGRSELMHDQICGAGC